MLSTADEKHRNLRGGRCGAALCAAILLARRAGECVSLRCYRRPGGAWAATALYCDTVFID
jgi:hypothetical protein